MIEFIVDKKYYYYNYLNSESTIVIYYGKVDGKDNFGYVNKEYDTIKISSDETKYLLGETEEEAKAKFYANESEKLNKSMFIQQTKLDNLNTDLGYLKEKYPEEFI